MFSGIYSKIFGKKHHHSHDHTTDDIAIDQKSNEDLIVRERRHSDEPIVTPGLYPEINPEFPAPGGLPYGTSPSLPDLRADQNESDGKEKTAVDLLHGVPFELASYIDIMGNEKDDKFQKFLERTKDVLSEDIISDGYTYSFDLEERILSEFQT